jgi:hypothetical protein
VIVSSAVLDYLSSVLKNQNKKSLDEGETTMKKTTWTMIISLILQALLAVAVNAQSGKPQLGAKGQGAPAQNAAVSGGGTSGRISKWAGVSGSNTFVLGDSGIFEDKFGKVGIGTTAPTSPLTVAGMIETTLGGYKFPDGTVQTTAALTSNQVVSSLNGLKGDVTLQAGPNVTLTPNGNTLIIAAPNALTSIFHGPTLTGTGAQALPLGVAVPLSLVGSTGPVANILTIQNTGTGHGIKTVGGNNSTDLGGDGIEATGGSSDSNVGGNGVKAQGGLSNSSKGGIGVNTQGGHSTSGSGGNGLEANGGQSDSNSGGIGVVAAGGNSVSETGGTGISAIGGGGPLGEGLAGFFIGDVDITGNLSKGGGSFKIDHPLDPENKYLYHSFVESPDMMNVYNGNITTDGNGDAVVELPDYFGALNKDFRYQLTVIGTFAQAMVAEEVKDNRFRIKTNAAGVKVSWQVTGIRQDAFANKNRIPVEVNKTESERGFYLHPKAFDQAEEKGIEWARNPEMMQQLKQQRTEADQKRKQQ